MTAERVAVRTLTSPARLRDAVALYRAVFALPATDPAVSPRLLVALAHNGGSVLGAFADDDLVGFVYGFPGVDAETGAVYHYSQMAAVRGDWQGQGVGRALKLGQREFVLSTGLRAMRWTYDPVRARNAHFNLDVLGAVGRWFVRDMYGMEDFGRDRGARTDRLTVEWDLTRPPVRPAGEHDAVPPVLPWGECGTDGTDVLLGLPSDWETVRAHGPEGAAALRDRLADRLRELIDTGHAVVSCRIAEPGTAVYRFRPCRAGRDHPQIETEEHRYP